MKSRRSFLKQKLALYFDENFPEEVVNTLRNVRQWKKKCKIHSVYENGNNRKDDNFIFGFCSKRGYTLVTLDQGFMNDSRYPFSRIPGIIVVVAKKNQVSKIQNCLEIILSFLSYFPKPKGFVGDTKFQVSENGCLVRGRDARTREIKERWILSGDNMYEIATFFNY